MNRLIEYLIVSFVVALLSGGTLAYYHHKWVDEGKTEQLQTDTDAAKKAIAKLDVKAGKLKTVDDKANTNTGTGLAAIDTAGVARTRRAAHVQTTAVPAACSAYHLFTADWLRQYDDGAGGVSAAAAGQARGRDGSMSTTAEARGPVSDVPAAVPRPAAESGVGGGQRTHHSLSRVHQEAG